MYEHAFVRIYHSLQRPLSGAGRCPVFRSDGVKKTSEGPLFGPTRLAGAEEHRTKPRAPERASNYPEQREGEHPSRERAYKPITVSDLVRQSLTPSSLLRVSQSRAPFAM